MFVKVAPLLIGVLSMCGCMVEATGPTQHDYRTIDLDPASELVRVNLDMGAGQLRVSGGSQKLMRADFTYNVPSWKPYVRYSGGEGRAKLDIEQPSSHHPNLGHMKYEWDLRLSRDVPMDMHVHFGAGEAQLDLGSLQLRSVDVEMGVGQIRMDLRGNPTRNYDVRIRGGVGEAIVHLPHDVGVYGEAEGGIGEIRMDGLRRDGNRFYNDAYDHAKVRIHLDVKGGIGSIQLISN